MAERPTSRTGYPAKAAVEPSRTEPLTLEREARVGADLPGMWRLHDLHSKLATETDLSVALDEILAAAIEFLGTERGCVQLVSADGERLEIVSDRGYAPGDRFIEHFRHAGSKPACDAARRDRRRLVIEDVKTFPPLAGTVDREVALSDGIRATQSTPMISRGGELVGVLSAQFPRPHRPSAAELRMVDLLAWSAADFVDRHNSEEALRSSEARQVFLLRLSDELRPLTEPGEIQLTAARVLAEHLGADRVMYGEVDGHDEDGSFRIEREHHRRGMPPAAGRHRFDDFGGYVAGRLREGLTVELPDVTAVAGQAEGDLEKYELLSIRSCVVVPLVSAGRIVACLAVSQRNVREWAPDEVALVEETAERTWAAVELTRTRAAAETERRRRERLEREFVANAAHELRTPLAAIMSSIDALAAGASEIPAERDRFLAHLRRESVRLGRLSDSLLLLARMDAASEVPHEAVAIRALLDEVVTEIPLRPDVTCTVHCPDDLVAETNPGLLERAVTNLAANAAKHTIRGSVELEGAASGSDVVIEVRDTGSGMPQPTRELAFDRFYRGESRAPDGFGLGLAIARQATAALKGKIELEPRAGGGTTARVVLPDRSVGRASASREVDSPRPAP